MRTCSELIVELCNSLTQAKSTLPRYKVLYETLRQQILDGLLLPGMCLPSSRVLSEKLNLSRNTVSAAIEQLCAEGYAIAKPKSGVYVLATAPVNWDKSANVSNSNKMKFNLSERGNRIVAQSSLSQLRGAFAAGIPDLKQFPFELWHRYLSRYLRNPKLDWQANPSQGGDLELRQTLVDYLRIARGISCKPSQILITHGTQHSLRLIADLLTDEKDLIWMEDPGYQGARSVFTAVNLTMINQPIDKEGIAPAKDAWQHPPRLIYTTPSHQFPTGVVMSASRRRQLLALAVKNQTWIIEDDYDSEFRYEGAPIAALHALAPHQVIYLGTFNKIFFPSIRIGYMVLPQPLVEAFRIVQARHQREPSYILQKTLADFIRDGHASAHIRKMRREYQIRRDTLVQVLRSELSDQVRLDGLDTGLHLIAYLPAILNDQLIVKKAEQQGIAVSALSKFYANSNLKKSGLILGFGDADQQAIIKAGKILCGIIKNL